MTAPTPSAAAAENYKLIKIWRNVMNCTCIVERLRSRRNVHGAMPSSSNEIFKYEKNTNVRRTAPFTLLELSFEEYYRDDFISNNQMTRTYNSITSDNGNALKHHFFSIVWQCITMRSECAGARTSHKEWKWLHYHCIHLYIFSTLMRTHVQHFNHCVLKRRMANGNKWQPVTILLVHLHRHTCAAKSGNNKRQNGLNELFVFDI